jgi:hypothetical protein
MADKSEIDALLAEWDAAPERKAPATPSDDDAVNDADMGAILAEWDDAPERFDPPTPHTTDASLNRSTLIDRGSDLAQAIRMERLSEGATPEEAQAEADRAEATIMAVGKYDDGDVYEQLSAHVGQDTLGKAWTRVFGQRVIPMPVEAPDRDQERRGSEFEMRMATVPSAIAEAWDGLDAPAPEAMTEAQIKPWLQRAKDQMGATAAFVATGGTANLADWVAEKAGYDLIPDASNPVRIVGDALNDRDVQMIAKGAGPVYAGTGLLAETPLPDVAGKVAELAESVGIADEGTSTNMAEWWDHARDYEAFDAANDFYETGDRSKVDALPYEALPSVLQGETPDVGLILSAAEQDPRLAGIASIRDRDPAYVMAQIRKLPVGVLSDYQPEIAPTNEELVRVARRRENAKDWRGTKQGQALVSLLSAGMVTPIGDGDDLLVVPSKIQEAMRFASVPWAAIQEADIPLTTALGVALPDAVRERMPAKLREARLPTTYGVEQMAESGAYDDWLGAMGLAGSRDFAGLDAPESTWLSRTLADTIHPDYANRWLEDPYLRAGGDPNSVAAKGLATADVIGQFLVPAEELALAPVAKSIAMTRRATAAARAARELGQSGKQATRAAFHAAAPFLVNADDGIEAVGRALTEQAIGGLRSGTLNPNAIGRDARRQVGEIAREVAGLPQAETERLLGEMADRHARILDAEQEIEKVGGPATRELRDSRVYQDRRADLDRLVAAGNLTPQERDLVLRFLEASAFRAVEDGAVASLEEFFGRHEWGRGETGERLPDGTLLSADGVKPLFHTTSIRNLESIATEGLVPRQGAGTFGHGGYDIHSQGKVFLADNPLAADEWFGKVGDILEAGSDNVSDHVPVMLRVKGRNTLLDEVGNSDVAGSRYVAETIPPEDIEFYEPGKGWRPVSEFDSGEHVPALGLTGDGDNAHAFGPYDNGGFKPKAAAKGGEAEFFAPTVRKPEPPPVASVYPAAKSADDTAVTLRYLEEAQSLPASEMTPTHLLYMDPDRPRLDPAFRDAVVARVRAGELKSALPTEPGKIPTRWRWRLGVDEDGVPTSAYDAKIPEMKARIAELRGASEPKYSRTGPTIHGSITPERTPGTETVSNPARAEWEAKGRAAAERVRQLEAAESGDVPNPEWAKWDAERQRLADAIRNQAPDELTALRQRRESLQKNPRADDPDWASELDEVNEKIADLSKSAPEADPRKVLQDHVSNEPPRLLVREPSPELAAARRTLDELRAERIPREIQQPKDIATYLLRLYRTGTVSTAFHEGTHLLDLLMGPDFTRRAAKALGYTDAQIAEAFGAGVDGRLFSSDGGVRGSIERRPQTDTPEFRAWFGDSKVVDADGRPLVVYHGTGDEFDTFSKDYAGGLFHFTEDEHAARNYSRGAGGGRQRSSSPKIFEDNYGNRWTQRAPDSPDSDFYLSHAEQGSPPDVLKVSDVQRRLGDGDGEAYPATATVIHANLRIRNPLDVTKPDGAAVIAAFDHGGDWGARNIIDAAKEASQGRYGLPWDTTKYEYATRAWERVIVPQLKKLGYDGLRMADHGHMTWTVFDPEQIKSALGNRGTFSPTDPNILHSGPVRPTDLRTQIREAIAEAGTRALRGQLRPGSKIANVMEDLREVVGDTWARVRGLPRVTTPEFRALWDELFRPSDASRPLAVKIVDERLAAPLDPRDGRAFDPGMKTVAVDGDISKRLRDNRVRAANPARDALNVSRANPELRQTLGLANSTTEIPADELIGRILGYIGTERVRKQWGFGELEALTSRVAIPKARAERVRREVAAVRAAALGKPAAPKNGVFTLTPDQQAGMRRMLDVLNDSPLSATLPERLRDPSASLATLTTDEWNSIVAHQLESRAGYGAFRERRAERAAKSGAKFMLGSLVQWAKGTAWGDVIRDFEKAFVLDSAVDEYVSPAMRDATAAMAREVAEDATVAKGEIIRAMRDGGQSYREVVASMVRGVPPEVVPVDQLGRLATVQRVQKATDIAQVVEVLPEIDRLFAQAPVNSVAQTADEARSIAALDNIGRRMKSGMTFDEALADAGLTPNEAADAMSIVQNGIKRRTDAVHNAGATVYLAFAGSADAAALAGITDPAQRAMLLESVYAAWYEGRWADIFDEVHHQGGAVSGANYDQGTAVLTAFLRLRANSKFASFADKMAAAGVLGDVADVAKGGRDFNRPYRLGERGETTRDIYIQRVSDYIRNMMGWSDTHMYVHATADTKPATIPGRGMTTSDGHADPAAYADAQRIVSQWGHKMGKGVPWTDVTLADGRTILVPNLVREAVEEAVNRVVPSGAAYRVGAADATRLGEVVDGTKTMSAKLDVVAANAVMKALVTTYNYSFGMLKTGLTTGIGPLIRPQFFIGNFLGGAFQLYQGVGMTDAIRIMARPFLPTGDGAAIRRVIWHMWRGADDVFMPTEKGFFTSTGAWHSDRTLAEGANSAGLNSSLARTELTDSIIADIQKAEPTLWNKAMRWPRGWQAFLREGATAIDNYYRVATYVDALKRGVAEGAAADLARKVAFDYNAITEFERTWLRKAVMFYSYQRASQGLFWDTLLTHPSRVLGQLRLLRGMQQQNLGEDSEAFLPSWADGRLIMRFREPLKDGHMADAMRGEVTVLPSIGVAEAIGLWLNILGAAEADPDAHAAMLAKLHPFAQAGTVMATGVQPYGRRPIDRYNVMPNWLVEMDNNFNGGMLRQIFQARRAQPWDEAAESYPGAPEWIVGEGDGARYWWIFRNMLPTGPAMDVVTAMQRADLGESLVGGHGFVQRVVDSSRAMAEEPLVQSGAEDTEQAREGLTEAEEFAGWLGFKPLQIRTREGVLGRLQEQKESAVTGAIKAEERAGEGERR